MWLTRPSPGRSPSGPPVGVSRPAARRGLLGDSRRPGGPHDRDTPRCPPPRRRSRPRGRRPLGRRHAALPGCRHGRARRERPSRYAAGGSAHGLDALQPPPQARPPLLGVGGPRPVRALGGPRVGAAVRAAPPVRLRAAHGRAQAVPPARVGHPRPPGVRPHRRGRDHDGSPRPGLRHRGRAGPRRAHAGGPLPRDHRPPHLRRRRGRLPDGGREPRGRVSRRAPAARAPGRALRRQRGHDRRQHRPVLQRRRTHSLRRLRLGRRPGGERQRRRGGRRCDHRGQGRPSTQLHRRPDSDRPRRPGVEGTPQAHSGSPLGPEVLAAAKIAAGWTEGPFTVPEVVREHCLRVAEAGRRERESWEERFAAFADAEPQRAATWLRTSSRALPDELAPPSAPP